MKTLLKKIKCWVAAFLKAVIVHSPLSLGLQTWAITRLLPMDPWPKSLVYQQCLANRVLGRYGAVVQRGPFRGMTCLDDAADGCIIPKLLGCYEEELSPTIEGFIARGYDRAIDVGCASGYYAAGFAYKQPRAEVFGFDIDQPSLARASKLAALNNVESRVRLLGLCTPTELEKLIKGRTLVMMDCEGAEYDLLDPKQAPALLRSDMIIEVHDFVNPKISGALWERFKESHSIEKIRTRKREPNPELYPELRVLPEKHWPAAVDERRPCEMEWMVFRSKVSALQG